MTRTPLRCLRGLIVVALLLLPAVARADTGTGSGALRVAERTAPLLGPQVRRLPFAADHVAVYWSGRADAAVRVAFSRDGARFGPSVDAGRDEPGPDRTRGVTYGALRRSDGASVVRLTSTH